MKRFSPGIGKQSSDRRFLSLFLLEPYQDFQEKRCFSLLPILPWNLTILKLTDANYSKGIILCLCAAQLTIVPLLAVCDHQ